MFGKTTLSDKMKNEAVSLGLCAQWTAEWDENSTKEAMVEKFIKGIDFCVARDWPSVKVIKDKFGDVIHDYGVYADENVVLRNPSKMIVLCGDCTVDMSLDNTATCEIYVRHTSVLNIKVTNLSKAFINILNDAVVNVECDEWSKVFVYQYGGTVNQIGKNVVIRDRHNFEWK